MNVLIISLHHVDRYPIAWYNIVSSLTLMQLAAVTPEKFKITALDNPININFNKDYDLVGISTVTPLSDVVYKIADEYRRKGTKVILGGYHVSALPYEAKQHADSVVIGEADYIWPQLLTDFENGNLKPIYIQDKPFDLNALPLPKRDIINKKSNITPIQFSRGCPIGCKYCAITHMHLNNNYRIRPIKQIVEELNTINRKYLWSSDACLTINVNYTKKIFKEMKDFDKKIFPCNGTVNILARDDELLKLANEAGCLEWLIGFESISQKSIDSVGKTINKVKEYKKAIKKIHDYGMTVRAEFIFGFDYDTTDIFKKTYDIIQETEIDNPQINILTPFPNTQLFNNFEKEGRILTKDWTKYNMWDVVFKPKNMTSIELKNYVYDLYDRIHSTSNTVRRIVNSAKFGLTPFTTTALKSTRFWFNRHIG